MKSFFILALFLIKSTFGAVSADQLSGTVLVWGANPIMGKANGAPLVGKSAVVEIAGLKLTKVSAIAAGGNHALALTTDGTVAAWGFNQAGEVLGYPTKGDSQTNGFVSVAGSPLRNIVSIAAGWDHSLAIQRDGTVIGWGNGRGGCTKPPALLSDVVAISAGWNKSLALRRNGEVVGWGLTRVPLGLSNIVAIFEGGDYQERGLGVTRAGSVVHWGVETTYADMTPPSGLSNIFSVAAGFHHSLALKRDGTVVGWGFNRTAAATGITNDVKPYLSAGLVTIGGNVVTDAIAIAASGDVSLALTKHGTIMAWGDNRLRQVEVPPDITNVCAIAAGDGFCIAIRKKD